MNPLDIPRRCGHTLSEAERLLANSEPVGILDQLMPRMSGAWELSFNDLTSLPHFNGEQKSLNICIATEDIVGPVRNGGIGTTYAALAEMLVGIGHNVVILYLRGRDVETGDLDHWVEHYANKGVRFVPVPNYAAIEDFRTGADRWMRAPYNMLRYLLDNQMDVVHVSEWRGSGYLSLLAKRQGLAFQNTVFIVKTSSPWLWNRLYGSHPLERLEDLAKIYAERRSVELADMVVGGSLYLLRWMASQGYRIPLEFTFVQPNVVSFDHLRALLGNGPELAGGRVPVDEVVFFGRLEARKGLVTFCHAIKRLVRLGIVPPKVTFMGKEGARLTANPDQSVLEYIADESRDWPMPVDVLTSFQQYEAIEYLRVGNRLAVMPSTIENSSLAVYEATICGIPFIATAAGGTPELVDVADGPHVLCQPHPISLAEKIAEALSLGAYVARPSFDNDANLAAWREFHRDLGRGLHPWLAEARRTRNAVAVERARISICLYYTGRDELLAASLASLAAQEVPPFEVLIAVDSDEVAATSRAEALAAGAIFPCRVIEAYDLDVGAAFSELGQAAQGEFALFLWEGATLLPHGLRVLSTVAQSSGADVLNYFYRVESDGPGGRENYLKATIISSTADAFFRMDLTATPLLVRLTTFLGLGGFTRDYRILAQDHEFIARAQLEGVRCETALIELGTVPAWDPAWLRQKGYDTALSRFRAIRPKLAAAPLSMREFLLMSKGLQVRAEGRAPVMRRKPSAVLKPAAPQEGGGFTRMLRAFWMDSENEPPAPASAETKRPEERPRRKAGQGILKVIDEAEAQLHPPPPAVAEREAPPNFPAFGSGTIVRHGGLSGMVLGVRAGVIHGWAIDEKDRDRPVAIELLEGGRIRDAAVADADLLSALRVPARVRQHGFTIRIPSRGPRWLDRGARRITLRFAGTDMLLAENLRIVRHPPQIKRSHYDGYCDPSGSGLVQGWVWRPDSPETQVDVVVFADGKFLARTSAATFREDLLAAGIGSGEHGFAVPLPRRLCTGAPHQVDVLVADEGIALARGPLQVAGNAVKPAGRG